MRRRNARRGVRGVSRGRRDGAEDVCSGQASLVRTTIVSGTAQDFAAVQPGSSTLVGSRCGDIADNWRFFRFTRLVIEFSSGDTAAEAGLVAYTPGIASATPTLSTTVSEMDKMAFAVQGQSVRSRLTLGRRDLQGLVPWYVTEAGGGALDLEQQGQVFFCTVSTAGLATASSLSFVCRWTCEFKGRLDPTMTLARKLRRLGYLPPPEWALAPNPPHVEEFEEVKHAEPQLVSTPAAPKALKRS